MAKVDEGGKDVWCKFSIAQSPVHEWHIFSLYILSRAYKAAVKIVFVT